MIKYSRELIVNWGESDPFGLVYFPRMLAWFNDTEHKMFNDMGYSVKKMVNKDRTAFVMGEIKFRFVGPAAYGDHVLSTISLKKITNSTLHWECKAINTRSREVITEGTAIRVYAQIQEDGNLKATHIPDEIRDMLT